MVDKKFFEKIAKELNAIKDKEKKREFLQKTISQTKDKEMIEKLRKLEKEVEMIRETRANELLDMSTRKTSDIEEAPKYQTIERREQTFTQESNLEQVVGTEIKREERQTQYGANLNNEVKEFNYNPINNSNDVRRMFETPGSFRAADNRYELRDAANLPKVQMDYEIKNPEDVRRSVETPNAPTVRRLEDFNKQYDPIKDVETKTIKRRKIFEPEDNVKYEVKDGRM